MDSIVLVSFLFVCLLFLCFILNIKAYFLKIAVKQDSIFANLPSTNSNRNSSKSFFYKLGSILIFLVPLEVNNKLIQNYYYAGKDPVELKAALGKAFTVFWVLLMIYIFTHNIVFLLLSFVAFVLISFESSFLVYQANIEIENNIEHLVRCLRILVVNNETPLVLAIEIIINELPDELMSLKLTLEKLVSQSKKIGLTQTLNEWETDLLRFKDFISVLIAINNGTSKKALKQYFDDFLNAVEHDNKERARSSSENFQLYLMGPIILILLVIMFPMLDAITFLMQNSGVV
jgi:hypothetical protein